MSVWTEEVLLSLIKLFRESVCLWNRKMTKYPPVRRERSKAWSEIGKSISTLCKQPVTAAHCEMKMRSLIQKYRREKMKSLTQKEGEVQSHWSLYDALCFLDNTTFRNTKLAKRNLKQMLVKKQGTTKINRSHPTKNRIIKATSVDKNEASVTSSSVKTTSTRESPRSKRSPEKGQLNTTNNAHNSFVTPAKRKSTRSLERNLRTSKTADLNTTENETCNPTSPENVTEMQGIRKVAKRAKIVNVIIRSPTAERNPTTPFNTPLDSCHNSVQDECQSFGMFVINKMRSYSTCTRSAVQHAISDILYNADMGYYDRLNSSSTVNTQTETRQSNSEQLRETTQFVQEFKSEELSDLDDDSISH